MSSKGLRKSHTKSRKGCSQCKARHQKCNESHPRCGSCERLDIRCSFTTTSLQPSRSGSLSAPSPSSAASSSVAQTGDSSDSEGSLPLTDLELLYNYLTDTANAFWYDSTRLEIFREKYIELGFKHTYVLHSALACSALHLYWKQPHRRDLLTKASAHQAAALRLVKPIISNLSEADCIPVFVFSTYTSVFAQAEIAVHLPGKTGDAIDDWVACTYLIRGVSAILEPYHHKMLNTWIAPVLQYENTEDEARPQVENLYGTHMNPLLDLADLENEPDREACRQAIESCFLYITVYSVCPHDDNSGRLVTTWPVRLKSRFLEMIAARHTTALIILAHYAVLLRKKHKAWWLAGWPEYLLQGIENVVGDSEHLRWPKENIFILGRG